MKIIVMGPQGSGKSTQAEILSKKLNIPHISTGDIFRALENDPSPLGKRVWLALSSGKLVSDQDTMDVVYKELAIDKYKKGYIIDGFPRNLYQAKNSPFDPDLILYLDVPSKISLERLLERKREDDTPELIKTRLQAYYDNTEPVLKHYENLGILRRVDGTKDVPGVSEEIYNVLGRNTPSLFA